MYNPKPEDISNVELPKEVDELLEALARNTHKVWAEMRIKDGWSQGLLRNDVKKKHPNLVPYEELPDNEREIDRKVTINVLKFIYKKGYIIINNDRRTD